MSKEINGRYSDSDREWLETVAGKRKIDPHEWDNLLSNGMANRILDRIAELEAQLERERIEARPVYKRLKQDIAELKDGYLITAADLEKAEKRIAELEANFNSSKELFALIPKERRELLERIAELEVKEIRERHEQESNPEAFVYRSDQWHQDRGVLLERIAELEEQVRKAHCFGYHSAVDDCEDYDHDPKEMELCSWNKCMIEYAGSVDEASVSDSPDSKEPKIQDTPPGTGFNSPAWYRIRRGNSNE